MPVKQPIGNILFFDIETAREKQELNDLDHRLKDLWIKRSVKVNGDDFDHAAGYIQEATFLAEFSRIACISYGYIVANTLRVKCLIDADERKILSTFSDDLSYFHRKGYALCGHNINEFDVPFMCRRYLINDQPLPAMINRTGKKPWDLKDIDTMDMWKFGAFKARNISLDLLAAVFGVESPKTDMDGSMVSDIFHSGDYDRITNYCCGDVATCAKVIWKLTHQEGQLQIIYAGEVENA